MNDIRKALQEMANRLATGAGGLSIKDVVGIASDINFADFKPEFLPPAILADNSVKKSKYAGLKYVEKLWGIDSDELVQLETGWLQYVRDKTGDSDNDEKDVPSDLVTPQILTRVVSFAYFIHRIQTDEFKMSIEESVKVVTEVLEGLNDFLANPVRKGRLRESKITVNGELVNTYNFLTRSGVHVGGYSKFLPYPEYALRFIFSHFCRDAILISAYK